MDELEGEFQCTASSVHKARELLQRLSPPLKGTSAEVASLVLSELVSNAVRHGCAGANNGIVVRLSKNSSLMRIEVDQTGPMFDSDEVRRLEPGRERGWGILLVQRLCSSWGLTPHGVWAAIQLED